MHHDTLHPWHLHLRGSLHVLQGWLTGDRQRVLQGRYERLLGEIGQVQRRANAASGAPQAREAVVPQQQVVA
jgi:hypothetical protein